MTEAQANPGASARGQGPGGARLTDALDHLLDPVGVIPFRPRATPQLGVELCRISYWRGWVKSQFVAIADRDGGEVALSTSPFFRVRGDGPSPDDGRARRALAALHDELAREGWEPNGRGGAWYEGTFRRPTRGLRNKRV